MVILFFYLRLQKKQINFVSWGNQNNEEWWTSVYNHCPSLKGKKYLIFMSLSLVYSNSFLYLIITEYLFCDKPSREVEAIWGKRTAYVWAKGGGRNISYETNLCFQYLTFLYGFNFTHTTYFTTFSLVLRKSGNSQHGKTAC